MKTSTVGNLPRQIIVTDFDGNETRFPHTEEGARACGKLMAELFDVNNFAIDGIEYLSKSLLPAYKAGFDEEIAIRSKDWNLNNDDED